VLVANAPGPAVGVAASPHAVSSKMTAINILRAEILFGFNAFLLFIQSKLYPHSVFRNS
jgi:hypothetical protein